MQKGKETFTVLVLGCSGGPRENNLSGYLVAPFGSKEYISLDAGTLFTGIERAVQRKLLPNLPSVDDNLTPAANFFLHRIKAYLISHAHLDHIAGLVINSQMDVKKSILGLDSTIDHLRDHIFNNKIWPNYGSEGTRALHHYSYIRLRPEKHTPIPGTELTVEAFELSHPNEYLSTAFLIECRGNYLLYFGDTSSDATEEKKRVEAVWKRVAPLVGSRALKGIFLECSYSFSHSDQVIYGHLDPRFMIEELAQLSSLANHSIKDIPIIVTHRKDFLWKGKDQKEIIAKELRASDSMGLHWIFPEPGDCFFL